MDQLYGTSGREGLVRISPCRLTGKEAEERPQPLAALGRSRLQHLVNPALMVVHHPIVCGQVWVRNTEHLLKIDFDEGQELL